MKKVLIWGLANIQYMYRWITDYEDKGEYTVVGYTAREPFVSPYRRYKFYGKDELSNVDFDYVMILANKSYSEIRAEAMELGVAEGNIFPGQSLISYNWNLEQYLKLQSSNISIMGYNCWGAFTYHNLALQFRSPLITMWETEEDFLNLMNNISGLVDDEPHLLPEMTEQMGHPVFELNGSKLYMNHYTNPQQALDKWNERKKRINMNNLFVMMRAGTREIAEEFAALPFNKKICFTTFETDIPYAITLPEMDADWRYINATARGQIIRYNPYSLLLDGIITKETKGI